MRSREILLAAVITSGALTLSAPAVLASDKERCKKDGWMALHREDGSSFKNQGQCVSYAAGGGTFAEDLPDPDPTETP